MTWQDSSPSSSIPPASTNSSSNSSSRSSGGGGGGKQPPYSKCFTDLSALPDGLISLKKSLELDGVALAIVNFAPGQGYTFTHSHDFQEEIYVCVQGRGLMQLDGEVLGMEPGDVVRVSPETRRSVYATGRLGGTGYSMNRVQLQEHFVLYVFGARPSDVEDGAPHYDDIPSWFADKAGIWERNQMLKERYDRMNVYNETNNNTERRRSTDELHRTKFMDELTRNDDGEAATTSSSSAHQLLVSSVLVDSERKKVLVSRSPGDPEGKGWEIPGGEVADDEIAEEALSRELKKQLGVEAHLESFESFAFSTTRRQSDGVQLVHLVYTCNDWFGEPKGLKGQEVSWLPLSQLKGGDASPLLRQVAAKIKPLLRHKANKKEVSG
ncbi:Nudix hydrolase domain-containing protein [Chloropicon primus]|nr:hypothetical protein A3770_09p55590 [Chloropicon primus]UPR02255.1 Nudix hydrolase domain-containing protein [Chloropicon primus]|eukprot:QDZ23041.1 hypothetical protein A3770_09p55590 [Chloropicon primus]